jgi:hypothetical protein
MLKVFVSYSHEDTDFAKELVKRLKKKGCEVWMDGICIDPGKNYIKEISRGIKNTDVVIPCLSPNSFGSEWVEREIFFSVENRKSILPVFIEFAKMPEGLDLVLTGIHYVDFSSLQKGGAEPWEELFRALDRISPKQEAGEFVPQTLFEKRKNKNIRWFITASAVALIIAVVGWIWIERYLRIKDGNLSTSITKSTGSATTAQVPGKADLPDPANIKLSGLSVEVQNTIKFALTAQREESAPSAAIMLLGQDVDMTNLPWRILNDGDKLSSQGNYLFALYPDRPAYFYIFQIDSHGKLDWLFPRNPYAAFSLGQNPVPSGRWTLIPDKSQAFYLDENLGVEHFYIIATGSPWTKIEELLGRASKEGVTDKVINTNFVVAMRGAGGLRPTSVNLPDLAEKKTGVVQQLIEGKAGAIVIQRWLKHVSPND